MNKEKVTRILNEFDRMFPDAACELVHDNELELLIAVMLSAQTTDASVNKLTKTLFQKYHTVEDYAHAPIEQLENDLRSIGLYRNKAKNVKAMAQQLIVEFGGQVPCDHDALQTLPGVGRKTANVVVSEGFKVPAIAVDTHVERISKRLGFALKKDSVLMQTRRSPSRSRSSTKKPALSSKRSFRHSALSFRRSTKNTVRRWKTAV